MSNVMTVSLTTILTKICNVLQKFWQFWNFHNVKFIVIEYDFERPVLVCKSILY